MIAQRGTWDEVQVDSYILGEDNAVWKCTYRTVDDRFTMVNRERQEITARRPAHWPVTLMVPTAEEAAAVLQQQLGATVIHEETT